MAKEKKKFGLKERDKQIIIIVLMAVVLFISYRLSTVTFAKKIEQYDKEIKKLEVKRDDLVDAENRRDEIEKDTERKTKEYENILGKFPERVTLEKSIEYLGSLYDNHKFGIGGLSMNNNGIFYTFVDSEGKENPELGAINSTTFSCEVTCDYKELKSLIDEINKNCPAKANITSISLGYDELMGIMSGNFSINVFSGCNIKKYVEPEFGVDVGNSNIFSKK